MLKKVIMNSKAILALFLCLLPTTSFTSENYSTLLKTFLVGSCFVGGSCLSYQAAKAPFFDKNNYWALATGTFAIGTGIAYYVSSDRLDPLIRPNPKHLDKREQYLRNQMENPGPCPTEYDIKKINLIYRKKMAKTIPNYELHKTTFFASICAGLGLLCGLALQSKTIRALYSNS